MPTPTLYQFPGGQPVFDRIDQSRQTPDLDLLFITDRASPTPAEFEAHAKDTGPLLYGQGRARHIAFGSAEVSITPALDWNTLREQSQLAERTRDVNLELSQVRQLGVFPEEPYRIYREDDGRVVRDRAELARHFDAKAELEREVERRLEQAPKKEVLLYVHGFTYEGKRSDLFGHSYFTTNPQVSSDLIQLIRYGKQLGEPGRELIKTSRVTWEFPVDGDPAH